MCLSPCVLVGVFVHRWRDRGQEVCGLTCTHHLYTINLPSLNHVSRVLKADKKPLIKGDSGQQSHYSVILLRQLSLTDSCRHNNTNNYPYLNFLLFVLNVSSKLFFVELIRILLVCHIIKCAASCLL